MDSKRIMVAALAAAFSGVAAGASMANAQEPERDYLVQIGKRPIFASELRKQQDEAQRKQIEQAARETRETRGRFIREGKVVLWREGGYGTASSAEEAKEPEVVKSKGRFVQRGKATFWVPNEK